MEAIARVYRYSMGLNTTMGRKSKGFPAETGEEISNGGQMCLDINGKNISSGLNYVPGPDACTVCRCEDGSPEWCQAVLCSPPQDCKSFRIGSSCCEFVCVDNAVTIPTAENGSDSALDLSLRLVASAVSIVFSLALVFFLFHRLRHRRQRNMMQQFLGPHNGSLTMEMLAFSSNRRFPPEFSSGGAEFIYREPPPSYFWKPTDSPPPYNEVVKIGTIEIPGATAGESCDCVHTNEPPCLSIGRLRNQDLHTSPGDALQLPGIRGQFSGELQGSVLADFNMRLSLDLSDTSTITGNSGSPHPSPVGSSLSSEDTRSHRSQSHPV